MVIIVSKVCEFLIQCFFLVLFCILPPHSYLFGDARELSLLKTYLLVFRAFCFAYARLTLSWSLWPAVDKAVMPVTFAE